MTETTTPDGAEAKAKAEADEKRAQAITKGYTVATTRLREKHLEEFNKLRVAATKELGYDWTPPPTATEKALAEARALVEQHPEILDLLTSETKDTPEGPVSAD